jgi:hypothetical protein
VPGGSSSRWRSGAWRARRRGATVHRVLVRNGLVTSQAQAHKRKYRRAAGDADGAVAAGSTWPTDGNASCSPASMIIPTCGPTSSVSMCLSAARTVPSSLNAPAVSYG